MGFLIKTLINGVALWVAALAVDGIHLGEDDPELSTRLLTIGLVALIFLPETKGRQMPED